MHWLLPASQPWAVDFAEACLLECFTEVMLVHLSSAIHRYLYHLRFPLLLYPGKVFKNC